MPTFRDLRTFLEREDGWEEVPNLVHGRQRTCDQRRYRKVLADSTILRTKVSNAPEREIGVDLLGHIVHDQLGTSMQHFRDVLAGRSTEPGPTREPEVEPIPGWLVMRLIHTVGLPEQEVRGMSAAEARAAWAQYRSEPGD